MAQTNSERYQLRKLRHPEDLVAEQKRWREAHPEMPRRLNARVRLAALNHYTEGRLECALCHFSDSRALEIDHIDGGGCAHRRELKRGGGHDFYHWLRKNNYPPGYRVLCRNCNWIAYLESKELSNDEG